jgi:hypothetical protein
VELDVTVVADAAPAEAEHPDGGRVRRRRVVVAVVVLLGAAWLGGAWYVDRTLQAALDEFDALAVEYPAEMVACEGPVDAACAAEAADRAGAGRPAAVGGRKSARRRPPPTRPRPHRGRHAPATRR